MPPPPPPPPPPADLPEDVVEEILLRFPPGEPASLFRAALVCKPWCRLISSPRFRRRFVELHRTPPMLGFLCRADFVPTNAFCPPRAHRFDGHTLDAGHGRVLVQVPRGHVPEEGYDLVVWDPITDEQRVLPNPPQPRMASSAIVLCAGAGSGVCNHIDCHHRPFLVVYVGIESFETFVCTYSSDVNEWTEPISTQNIGDCLEDLKQNVLVGNALYFGMRFTSTKILKYNLESREMSWIQLPYESSFWESYVLTTTKEGVLGLVTVVDSKLSMWLRKDDPEVDAGWTKSRVIDLKTLLPLDGVFTSPYMVGFANGHGIVFMMVESVIYTLDLKTYKVKLYSDRGNGDIGDIIPYMRFYTPELEAFCTGEDPSAGVSTA